MRSFCRPRPHLNSTSAPFLIPFPTNTTTSNPQPQLNPTPPPTPPSKIRHENLIKLVDAYVSPTGDFYVVTEGAVRRWPTLAPHTPHAGAHALTRTPLTPHCPSPLPFPLPLLLLPRSFYSPPLPIPPQECELLRIITPTFDLLPEHVQYITYGILRGLKYLHSAGTAAAAPRASWRSRASLLPDTSPLLAGILHRDLKPSNIFINSALDVSLARHVSLCLFSPSAPP